MALTKAKGIKWQLIQGIKKNRRKGEKEDEGIGICMQGKLEIK